MYRLVAPRGFSPNNMGFKYVNIGNRAAEIVEKHVQKGTKLVVEGQLTYRSWEDEAGVKHFRTEVVGLGLMLL